MVRSLLSATIALLILAGAAIGEQIYLNKTFKELDARLTSIYEKIENETITNDDVTAVQSVWHERKKTLHVFLSHNDVKEFDLWIAETVSYVKQKNYGEALDKVEVAIELTRQIPKGYLIRFENIF